VRSILYFPVGERDEIAAFLDRTLPEQRDPWLFAGNVYLGIVDEETEYNLSGEEPDFLSMLDAALGYRPTWAVGADVSGRIDGTEEVRQLAALLLQHGGVAVDDYSAHAWTLAEIESDAEFDGLRFFDFLGYYRRPRKPCQCGRPSCIGYSLGGA
jgi:hypothetical protein